MNPLIYESFILRMWLEFDSPDHQLPVWRFSLENTDGSGRVGFSTMGELCDYLNHFVQKKAG